MDNINVGLYGTNGHQIHHPLVGHPTGWGVAFTSGAPWK
jgi:hypothetical protein